MRKRTGEPIARLKIVLILLAVAAVLTALYQGGRWLERRAEKPEPQGDYQARTNEETVTYDGVSYRRRRNVTAVLLLGIDNESGEKGGQADFLQLMVIDDTAKTVKRLALDRDTMTPIPVLDLRGKRAGVRTAQLSLSHGFGDGKEQSCALTAEAASTLLGEPIDFYLAMNFDGIATLNDMAGGVTVTLADNFSALDPEMVKGATLTLRGRQAEIFTRSRMSVGTGTNEARMERQNQYLERLLPLLEDRLRNDQSFSGALLDALSPFLITDMSRGRLINAAWAAKDYVQPAPLSIAGVHQIGSDGFMQFYADEDSLRRAVLELFYEAIE
ncbi:MAG: LCP family protein [Clostridiales bacterium]|nr:LCP family protein [Clostridiales bacterium]